MTDQELIALEDGAGATDPLTSKQRAFVLAYLETHDPATSAVRAGYSEKTSHSIASRLLRVPLIAAEIDRAELTVLKQVQRASGVTLERTLTEIAKTAFFDVRGLFNADGSPKDITELDAATASAIVGIEVSEQWQGSGEDRVFVGHVKKYRLADRQRSLDMLMKHLGAYKADNEQAGNGAVNALGALLQQMRGSTLPVVRDASSDA